MKGLNRDEVTQYEGHENFVWEWWESVFNVITDFKPVITIQDRSNSKEVSSFKTALAASPTDP